MVDDKKLATDGRRQVPNEGEGECKKPIIAADGERSNIPAFNFKRFLVAPHPRQDATSQPLCWKPLSTEVSIPS
jgi:hypothetical protein